MAFAQTRPDNTFILYGMDTRGAVVSTERLVGLTDEDLRRLAEERLKLFEMVEVHQGGRCLILLERPAVPD